MELSQSALYQAISKAGIKTQRSHSEVFLSFNDKVIKRPLAFETIEVVRKEFGIDLLDFAEN